jgi:hypothetical protein
MPQVSPAIIIACWVPAQVKVMPPVGALKLKKPAICLMESAYRYPRIFFIIGAFCGADFVILDYRTDESRDPHSQTPAENHPDDTDKHNSGAARECIPRQGYEKRGDGRIRKNRGPHRNCCAGAQFRLYLVRHRVFVGIFRCPHVVADLGRL